MKCLLRLFSKTILPVMLTLLLCLSCSIQEEPELPPDEEEELTPQGADALLETIRFNQATKVKGNIPSVANTSLIKTNTKDTIPVMAGIQIPIRLIHPVSAGIGGIFIAIEKSTFYYDVPVTMEEESDTVAIILLEIDPQEVEVPYGIPVKIVPYDKSKNPMDELSRTISVEKPSANGCDILIPKPSTLGDTSGVWSPEWFWFATMVFNPAGEITFLNAPGKTFITSTKYEGCCDPNRPGGKCHPLSTTINASVQAQVVYTIESETFAFFTDGTFARQTHEQKQNFNPETTDWCAGSAGYNRDEVIVTYIGKHDYVPGNKTISYGTHYASCDLCGYGSRGGNLEYSCHMLTISRQSGESKEIRLYVRNPVSEWYD